MCSDQIEIKLEDYDRLIMKLARPYAIREKCDVRDSEAYSIGLLVFTEILPKWDSSRSSFATFLFLSVTQRLWKLSRRQLSIKSWSDIGQDPAWDPKEFGLYEQDLIDKLRACVNRFPEGSRDRVILSMRIEGHTYKDIAEVVGHSRANAESYFKRNILPVLIDHFQQELAEDGQMLND